MLRVLIVSAVIFCCLACDDPPEADPPTVAEGDSHHATAPSWLAPEDPARDRGPMTRMILAQLDVEEGQRVADIGAGGGYFSFKLAEVVGPEGKVFATDAADNAIEVLTREREARETPQVVPVKVGFDELGEGVEDLDRMLIVNVYFFKRCADGTDETTRRLKEIARAMRPDGRLVIEHDVTHTSGGSETGDCVDVDAETLIAAASPWFQPVYQKHLPLDPRVDNAGLGAGYLVALERKP